MISKCVRLGESGNNATKRSNKKLSTNVGPRHTQQARKGPIPSFANFGTHGNGCGCLVPARCSGGVNVGNVPDEKCSHLECSRRKNLYVQTCTKRKHALHTLDGHFVWSQYQKKHISETSVFELPSHLASVARVLTGPRQGCSLRLQKNIPPYPRRHILSQHPCVRLIEWVAPGHQGCLNQRHSNNG